MLLVAACIDGTVDCRCVESGGYRAAGAGSQFFIKLLIPMESGRAPIFD